MSRQFIGLLGWLGATFLAAALGAIASVDAAEFYSALVRPDWAPPSDVFGPVWTVLYAIMGVAAWLVWRERDGDTRVLALRLYGAQLVVNALWSWLFFRWHLGALAFVDVVALALLVAATAWAFWRVRPLAGALLLPYLGWVCFASALTWAVWQRNPALLG